VNFSPQAVAPNSPRKLGWIYQSSWGVALYDLWSRLLESRSHARALEIAAPRPGESVLELATGTGTLFARIARAKGLRRCIGLDLSWEMLARTQRRLARPTNSRVVLCRGDCGSLPFANHSFDLILSCYLLDLLAEYDLRSTVQELQRVLRPTGRSVLLVMARQSRVIQGVWMWLYSRWPELVGRCRPVPVADFLSSEAWTVVVSEQIIQCGFRSDLRLVRLAHSNPQYHKR
jgi:ubiquinone/menaquinone biosynthesis C-methylase UbiE